MENENYLFEIKPEKSLFKLGLKEIWRYRDLLMLFVRRDFVAQYKQTILGPLWFLIQPLLTSVVLYIMFHKVAKIDVGNNPYLFYLAGTTAWSYFATCIKTTSNTFTLNAGVFGKVYFPRLVSPLSIVISNLVKFAIQFVLFLGFYVYFILAGADVHITVHVLLMPLLIIMMGGIGLGIGLIVSSLTTKYRDFTYLMEFAVQLLMYATPIIYPISLFPEKYQWIIKMNPMTGIIETFRMSFLGGGIMDWSSLVYSFVVMVLVLVFGMVVFNRTEKNFMDTV